MNNTLRMSRAFSGTIGWLRSGAHGVWHIVPSEKQTQMALISQMTQMNSVRAAEPICAICGISEICVGFWISRDA